ncbi:hypothetical protein G6F68_015082 [Rhizopus microsporus]|nr:hypothetical protein G6F68_015082 [Rhizopus microsporus]
MRLSVQPGTGRAAEGRRDDPVRACGLVRLFRLRRGLVVGRRGGRPYPGSKGPIGLTDTWHNCASTPCRGCNTIAVLDA